MTFFFSRNARTDKKIKFKADLNVICIFCSLFSCDNDEVLLLIHKFSSLLGAQFLVRVGIYMSLVNLAGFNPFPSKGFPIDE